MACGGFICSRNTLVFLNVMYFIVGMTLAGLAGYAKVIAVITNIPVMSGLITCGVFLAAIAVVGLIGAIKHHQVLLFFYMIILFLVFLLQFSIACASLALSDQQQSQLYLLGWSSANNDLRQRTQIYFECCGMNKTSQDDISSQNNTSHSQHPQCFDTKDIKCSADNKCCFNATATAETGKCPLKDCWTQIEPRLHDIVRAVGAIGLFFSFTEIIGIWLAFRYRNQKDRKANPGDFL